MFQETQTPPESIKKRLSEAWNFVPLTTLKLICNLRGVRGTGKSDKKGYYAAAIWLHQFHPKTLACNVPSMANFGYFKDLPEILYRILEEPDVTEAQRYEWRWRKSSARMKRHKHVFKRAAFGGPIQKTRRTIYKSRRNNSRAKKKAGATREIRILNALKKEQA